MSSDSAWARASGFHSSRKPSVSRTRTPGATSRLPAPPSTMSRATPARERPSSRARAAAGSVSGVLPKPVPTVLMARSWPGGAPGPPGGAGGALGHAGGIGGVAGHDGQAVAGQVVGRRVADDGGDLVPARERLGHRPGPDAPARAEDDDLHRLLLMAAILPDTALRAYEPRQPDDRQHRGDEEVQAQAEDVLGRVDAQQLLEDPEGRVARDVEREEPGCADGAAPSQPHQEGRQGQVPDDLVEEGGGEGGAVEVARQPVVAVDLEAPRQRGRAPVELLVEVVADATDGLRDEQRR